MLIFVPGLLTILEKSIYKTNFSKTVMILILLSIHPAYSLIGNFQVEYWPIICCCEYCHFKHGMFYNQIKQFSFATLVSSLLLRVILSNLPRIRGAIFQYWKPYFVQAVLWYIKTAILFKQYCGNSPKIAGRISVNL